MQNSSNLQHFSEAHIKGTCMEMCPSKERQMREKEGLLHKFEILTTGGSRNSAIEFAKYGKNRTLSNKAVHRADSQKAVKSFARSAAGMDKTIPADLRPSSVLLQTVKYLCTKILVIPAEPFPSVYDFIFDRFRSIRQDLVIQRIQDENSIKILETIVRFHTYAAYRLRQETISNFDAHINSKHLVDCLKRLISLYELNNYWCASRIDFEALYCFIAPNSFDVISRALSIRRKINSKLFDSAIQLCLAYQSRNYVEFFRLSLQFPPLISTYLVQHVKHMRKSAYQVLSSAYGFKTCKYPVKYIMTILAYHDRMQPLNDLRHLRVEIVSDDNKQYYARFSKGIVITDEQMDVLNFDMNGPNRGIDEPEYIQFVSKLICPW